jgi:hypothetical protein
MKQEFAGFPGGEVMYNRSTLEDQRLAEAKEAELMFLEAVPTA